jgi:asparagine synthase (glutamine-hydrolysing)
MSQLLYEPVCTFTIGWTYDLSVDERPYATIAARHFRTDHTEFAVKTDPIALMELLLWHNDQPFGDSSGYPHLPGQQADAATGHGSAQWRWQ